MKQRPMAEMLGVAGPGGSTDAPMYIRLHVPAEPGLCGADVSAAATATALLKVTAPTLPAVMRMLASHFEAMASELEREGWGTRWPR